MFITSIIFTIKLIINTLFYIKNRKCSGTEIFSIYKNNADRNKKICQKVKFLQQYYNLVFVKNCEKANKTSSIFDQSFIL